MLSWQFTFLGMQPPLMDLEVMVLSLNIPSKENGALVKAGVGACYMHQTMSKTEICLPFRVNFEWNLCASLLGRYCGCKINLFRIIYSVYIVLNVIYCLVRFSLALA